MAALGALWIGAAAALYLYLLVANWSDNAYIGIALIGFALEPVGVLWTLAALLPYGGARRIAVLAAAALLWLVGLLGLIILVPSIAIIPSQPYPTNQVLISHLAALAALLATLVFPGWLFRR